ncbi:hypothetical protein MMC07_000594 [Pseudocyphellaria aurata]|nr:hypothetical protein [Pseudocyphellaria aurata]
MGDGSPGIGGNNYPDKSTQIVDSCQWNLELEAQFEGPNGSISVCFLYDILNDNPVLTEEHDQAVHSVLGASFEKGYMRNISVGRHTGYAPAKKRPKQPEQYKACLALGADFDQMLLAIHTYGNRNETLHNHVGTYAEEGKYAKLAETLSKDLNDLKLRDKWFEIEFDKYIQPPPDECFPTEALRDMHRNRKLPEVKAAAKEEHDKPILRGAHKRLHRAGQIQELVQQLWAKPEATALFPPGPQREKGNKRQVSNSNHLSPSKRKKVWLAISKHQVRACSAFSSSLDLQKQVNMMTASA